MKRYITHKDSEGFTYYTNVAGSTGSKTQNSSKMTPTGATERNKANNIYDMAGNVWEWTMESYSTNVRRYRGGKYNNTASNYSVGHRGSSSPYSSYSNVRCACVLLHKIEILQGKILFYSFSCQNEILTKSVKGRLSKWNLHSRWHEHW